MKDILHKLSNRVSLDNVDKKKCAGIYALYLKKESALANIPANSDGLIYIGRSKNLSKRDIRDHFSSTGTGSSTVRRSIGALLKDRLKLHAIPRSSGQSKTNYRNYKFRPEEEIKLTAWMKENLEIGVCDLTEIKSTEDLFIKKLKPFLNLKGWNNPARSEIKRKRKICSDEARKRMKV